MRRGLRKLSYSYSATFFLLVAIWLMLLAKNVGANQDSPDEKPSKNLFEKLGTIRGDDRLIGLLESLENQDIHYKGKRFTKDNVWIVRDGVSVFVKPASYRRVLKNPLEAGKKNSFVITIVIYDVYDETNEYILIPKGTHFEGPAEVEIANGQVKLTVTGNGMQDPIWRTGHKDCLIETCRILVDGPFLVPIDLEKWNEVILKNPPLSATLISHELDAIEESDSSKMRLSRNSEGQLHILLPEIIILTVRRPLYFTSPQIKLPTWIPKKKL